MLSWPLDFARGLRTNSAPRLPPRPFPHRLHRSDRLRDGHPVPLVLRARIRRERHDRRDGGRHLLDHAVLLRAGVGEAVGPHRPAAGDPDQPHRESAPAISSSPSRAASDPAFSRASSPASAARTSGRRRPTSPTRPRRRIARKGWGSSARRSASGSSSGRRSAASSSHLGRIARACPATCCRDVAAGLSFIALPDRFFVLGGIEAARLVPRAGFRRSSTNGSGARSSHSGMLACLDRQRCSSRCWPSRGWKTSVTLHARDRFHFAQLRPGSCSCSWA